MCSFSKLKAKIVTKQFFSSFRPKSRLGEWFEQHSRMLWASWQVYKWITSWKRSTQKWNIKKWQKCDAFSAIWISCGLNLFQFCCPRFPKKTQCWEIVERAAFMLLPFCSALARFCSTIWPSCPSPALLSQAQLALLSVPILFPATRLHVRAVTLVFPVGSTGLLSFSCSILVVCFLTLLIPALPGVQSKHACLYTNGIFSCFVLGLS